MGMGEVFGFCACVIWMEWKNTLALYPHGRRWRFGWLKVKGVFIYLLALNNKGVGIDDGLSVIYLLGGDIDFFDSRIRIFDPLVVLNFLYIVMRD